MLVLDTPPFDPLPKAEPHGNQLYCWIAVHADGSEGVLSHTMPSGLTMPLVTAQKWLAEGRLATMAQQVAARSARAGNPIQIELQIFDLTRE